MRCVAGTLLRLRATVTAGGAAQYPAAGDASLSVRGAVVPGSGAVRYYQTCFRNSAAAFRPPATSNVTNGWFVAW